jgi:hypothetical protein
MPGCNLLRAIFALLLLAGSGSAALAQDTAHDTLRIAAGMSG